MSVRPCRGHREQHIIYPILPANSHGTTKRLASPYTVTFVKFPSGDLPPTSGFLTDTAKSYKDAAGKADAVGRMLDTDVGAWTALATVYDRDGEVVYSLRSFKLT